MKNLVFAILLIIIILGAVMIAGGGIPGVNFSPSQTTTTGGTPIASVGSCCDSGNGDACKPLPDQSKLTYNGQEYGLLKSDVTLTEGAGWLKDSGQQLNGNPIILNNTQDYHDLGECNGNPKSMDQIYNIGGGPVIGSECFTIPDDEIVYVCKTNCTGQQQQQNLYAGQKINSMPVYGPNSGSTYDVYFRLSDYQQSGIPDPVKNCSTALVNAGAPNQPVKQLIVVPTYNPEKNLQLQTFKIINVIPQTGSSSWISPYCKPAVYLYPQQDSFVTVQLPSYEKLTYTDPLYPANGWHVFAHSSGLVDYQKRTYDYLYYETSLPDAAFIVPSQGFVIADNQLANFFNTTLPKTGLGIREIKQFSEYWLHALPTSPYYFIGFIPEQQINAISPLTITPHPQTLIRVTVYFKPLATYEKVPPPLLQSTLRQGFTVVEWGGIFKKDAKHNFSCYM